LINKKNAPAHKIVATSHALTTTMDIVNVLIAVKDAFALIKAATSPTA
jgi:hypothetical protein